MKRVGLVPYRRAVIEETVAEADPRRLLDLFDECFGIYRDLRSFVERRGAGSTIATPEIHRVLARTGERGGGGLGAHFLEHAEHAVSCRLAAVTEEPAKQALHLRPREALQPPRHFPGAALGSRHRCADALLLIADAGFEARRQARLRGTQDPGRWRYRSNGWHGPVGRPGNLAPLWTCRCGFRRLRRSLASRRAAPRSTRRILLKCVRQLVGEQPAAVERIRLELTPGKCDIPSSSEGPGAQIVGRLCCRRLGVNAHRAEIGAES